MGADCIAYTTLWTLVPANCDVIIAAGCHPSQVGRWANDWEQRRESHKQIDTYILKTCHLYIVLMSPWHLLSNHSPEWNVKGKLGALMQPLATVATVTTIFRPQRRSVREQPVPLEVQVWLSMAAAGDTAVTTYWSACAAAFQVTWPTLPAHCRDTWTLVGGQGPGGQSSRRKGQKKAKMALSITNLNMWQIFPSNIQLHKYS